MKVRPNADSHLGWAFRPDSDTVAALGRGRTKLKDHNLGVDRPHQGGSGNLAEALVKARKVEDTRRFGKRRRRHMARMVISASKKKTPVKAVSKKRTKVEAKAPSGKLIPLKTICAELDLDPKATRVKLRRMIANEEINFHDHAQRWEFTPAQAKVVRQALNS